jgi:hypothetical protein
MKSLETAEVLNTLQMFVGLNHRTALPLQTQRITLQLSNYKKPRKFCCLAMLPLSPVAAETLNVNRTRQQTAQ